MTNTNHLAASPDTNGGLFQVFSFPKSGGSSSYLFSDIIKIVEDESVLSSGDLIVESTNSINTGSANQNIDKNNLIDSSALLNLLFAKVNGSKQSNDSSKGNYFISREELESFVDKLGLENTSPLVKNQSEIIIEVKPDLLSKIIKNTEGDIKKTSIGSLLKLNDSQSSAGKTEFDGFFKVKGNNEKIKIVFKKVQNEPAKDTSKDSPDLQITSTGTSELDQMYSSLSNISLRNIFEKNAGTNKSQYFINTENETNIEHAAGTPGNSGLPADKLFIGTKPQDVNTNIFNQPILLANNLTEFQNSAPTAEYQKNNPYKLSDTDLEKIISEVPAGKEIIDQAVDIKNITSPIKSGIEKNPAAGIIVEQTEISKEETSDFGFSEKSNGVNKVNIDSILNSTGTGRSTNPTIFSAPAPKDSADLTSVINNVNTIVQEKNEPVVNLKEITSDSIKTPIKNVEDKPSSTKLDDYKSPKNYVRNFQEKPILENVEENPTELKSIIVNKNIAAGEPKPTVNEGNILVNSSSPDNSFTDKTGKSQNQFNNNFQQVNYTTEEKPVLTKNIIPDKQNFVETKTLQNDVPADKTAPIQNRLNTQTNAGLKEKFVPGGQITSDPIILKNDNAGADKEINVTETTNVKPSGVTPENISEISGVKPDPADKNIPARKGLNGEVNAEPKENIIPDNKKASMNLKTVNVDQNKDTNTSAPVTNHKMTNGKVSDRPVLEKTENKTFQPEKNINTKTFSSLEKPAVETNKDVSDSGEKIPGADSNFKNLKSLFPNDLIINKSDMKPANAEKTLQNKQIFSIQDEPVPVKNIISDTISSNKGTLINSEPEVIENKFTPASIIKDEKADIAPVNIPKVKVKANSTVKTLQNQKNVLVEGEVQKKNIPGELNTKVNQEFEKNLLKEVKTSAPADEVKSNKKTFVPDSIKPEVKQSIAKANQKAVPVEEEKILDSNYTADKDPIIIKEKLSRNNQIPDNLKVQVPENEFRSFRKNFPDEFYKEKIEVKPVIAEKPLNIQTEKNIYHISFDTSEVKSAPNTEKVLQHNFNTADYEKFSTETLIDKPVNVFKENRTIPAEETSKEFIPVKPADTEHIGTSMGKEGSNFTADTQEQKNSGYAPERQHTEINFAEHIQASEKIISQVGTNNIEMPSRDEAPFYRNINLSQLPDEIKNLMVKKEKANITLKLNPEHLGNVKLIIDVKNSIVSTRIEVENESVRQTVQNSVETLRQSLQQNGIQLSSFSVSLSNQEQKPHGKSESKKKFSNESKDIRIEEEIKPGENKKMGYNTYEYLA